jgi:hypothetical protein
MTRHSLTIGNVAEICEVSPRVVRDWCDLEYIDGTYRLPVLRWRGKGRERTKRMLGDRRIPADALRRFMKRLGMPEKWLDDWLRKNSRAVESA